MKFVVSATLLFFVIGVGSALAQAPAPTPAPAAQSTAPAKMSPDDKKAISKSCTDQANAKGLHGKERKKFRSDCKHNGGKPS
jgi:hypothetical protein